MSTIRNLEIGKEKKSAERRGMEVRNGHFDRGNWAGKYDERDTRMRESFRVTGSEKNSDTEFLFE